MGCELHCASFFCRLWLFSSCPSSNRFHCQSSLFVNLQTSNRFQSSIFPVTLQLFSRQSSIQLSLLSVIKSNRREDGRCGHRVPPRTAGHSGCSRQRMERVAQWLCARFVFTYRLVLSPYLTSRSFSQVCWLCVCFISSGRVAPDSDQLGRYNCFLLYPPNVWVLGCEDTCQFVLFIQ